MRRRSKQKASARDGAEAKGAAYVVDAECEQPVNNGCPRPTLPAVADAAVGRIHHGQIGTQLAVKCAVGVLHGGRRGDRCDLADALAAVCHGQQLVLLHVNGVDIRNLGRTEQPERTVPCLGYTVLERPVLGKRIAHTHEYATFDLTLDGDGVDHLAGIVRGIDLAHAAVVVQNNHMRGKAVADVALGVGNIRTQLVGRLQVHVAKLASLERLDGGRGILRMHTLAGDELLRVQLIGATVVVLDLDAVAMRIHGKEETGAEKFWVGVSTFLPGGGAEWAYEDNPLEKVYYVLEGEMTVTDKDGKKYVIHKNESISFPPNEGRGLKNESNLPARMLVIINYPNA